MVLKKVVSFSLIKYFKIVVPSFDSNIRYVYIGAKVALAYKRQTFLLAHRR